MPFPPSSFQTLLIITRAFQAIQAPAGIFEYSVLPMFPGAWRRRDGSYLNWVGVFGEKPIEALSEADPEID
jgi:hypothetical protein